MMRRDSQRRFDALRRASWDAVYMMSADWSQMHALDGRGFIADTNAPSESWLEKYIAAEDQPYVLAAIRRAVEAKDVSNSSTGYAAATAPSAGPCPGPYRFWMMMARSSSGRCRHRPDDS